MIPDIQLVHELRIARRDEVDGVVGHVDDELVGANAVERRNLVVREIAALDLQPQARVRETGNRALRFGPLQNGQVP